MESGGTGDMMAVTRESKGWWIAVTAQQDQWKGVYQSADEDLVLDLLPSHEIPLAPGNDSSLRWRKACFLDWIFCKDHHGTGSHQRPEAMLVSIVHAVAPGFNEAWYSCRSMQSVLPWGGILMWVAMLRLMASVATGGHEWVSGPDTCKVHADGVTTKPWELAQSLPWPLLALLSWWFLAFI